MEGGGDTATLARCCWECARAQPLCNTLERFPDGGTQNHPGASPGERPQVAKQTPVRERPGSTIHGSKWPSTNTRMMRLWYSHKMECHSAKKQKRKKKTSTNTCHRTEGLGKRDARQKAAAPKDHKRQSSISVRCPKKGQSMEPESRLAVAGLEQGPTANRTEGPRLSDGDVPSTSDWAVAARL